MERELILSCKIVDASTSPRLINATAISPHNTHRMFSREAEETEVVIVSRGENGFNYIAKRYGAPRILALVNHAARISHETYVEMTRYTR